jgi:uncharacterized protein (DUF488 family)
MNGAVNPVLTVGHSSHAIGAFLKLLEDRGVDTVVDTRSSPRSKFAPQYDIESLRDSLQRHGIRYLYMGAELGGRPKGDGFYDRDGRVLYSRVAESPFFLKGIERLEREISEHKVALLCSEENPSVCHRRLLIARVLRERGFAVAHIRGDGAIEQEDELLAKEASQEAPQMALFEFSRIPEWKSIPSVLPRRQRSSSLIS